MYTAEDIGEILPKDTVAPGDYGMLSDWFIEGVDLEQLRAECRTLHGTKEGRTIAEALRCSAPIEDATTTDYLPIVLAAGQSLGDERIKFLEESWAPQEYTHGTAGHSVVDWAARREHSAREPRNQEAAEYTTLEHKAGILLVKKVLGRVDPDLLATLAMVKGVANEANPEFIYRVCANLAGEIYLPTLQAVLQQMSKEEGVHRGQYWLDAKERLEDNSENGQIVRWLDALHRKIAVSTMRRHKRLVGSERLGLLDQIRLSHLFNPNDPEHQEFAAKRDDRFSSLPGMEGVRPLEATITRYNKHDQI